jgi:hypothetical protein
MPYRPVNLPAAGTLIWVVVIDTVTVLLYLPVFGLELTGDDYQLLQAAHDVLNQPLRLVAGLDSLWRPAVVLTLVADHLVSVHQSTQYHATNLGLHLVAGVMLLAVARRYGLSVPAAAAASMLWLCSSFAVESAVWVAARADTLLLIGWLMLLLVWPQPSQQWRAGRIVGAVAALGLAAGAKETWIAMPLLVVVVELHRRGGSWRRAAPVVAGSLVIVAAYLAVRLVLSADVTGSYAFELASLAKLPHMLASFFFFEELTPLNVVVTWKGLAALAATTALGIGAVRGRNLGATVGATILVAGLLPTLFVPYLPQRYTVIPYAGFVLLVVSAAAAHLEAIVDRWKRGLTLVAAAFAGLACAASMSIVRADLRDWQRVSEAHRQVLDEAKQVVGELPVGVPILSVRQEQENPLREIAATPRGSWKLLWPRRNGPYGLVDVPALFEWAGDCAAHAVRTTEISDGDTGAVLVHHDGGFELVDSHNRALNEILHRATRRGLPTEVMIITPRRSTWPFR